MPRLKPPFFPAAKGLYLQPTVVNNVETLANLPWIVRHGGEAFAALGGGGAAWLEKILHRIENGTDRDDDLELLLDVGDNISPGPFPRPPLHGEPAVPFPFKQTTICPLGPSAVSPVYSSILRFRMST